MSRVTLQALESIVYTIEQDIFVLSQRITACKRQMIKWKEQNEKSKTNK